MVNPLGERAAKQLEQIRAVHHILLDAQVEHWLAGGWGIDFLLGAVTREHGDIDIALWLKDWPQAETLLLKQGFQRSTNEFPDETARLVRHGQKLEIWLLRRDESGRAIVGGRWADWPFPIDSFGSQIGRLQGMALPVMSAEGQLDAKEGWPRHRFGAPLRDKDAQDIALLRQLLSDGTRAV